MTETLGAFMVALKRQAIGWLETNPNREYSEPWSGQALHSGAFHVMCQDGWMNRYASLDSPPPIPALLNPEILALIRLEPEGVP